MDTIQEYFSEIENEIRKESNGKPKESHRHTSKKEEYEKISCKLILLIHLSYPAQRFENIDIPEV